MQKINYRVCKHTFNKQCRHVSMHFLTSNVLPTALKFKVLKHIQRLYLCYFCWQSSKVSATASQKFNDEESFQLKESTNGL